MPQADVSLTNQAQVNVLSSSGGSIAVNAGNLNMSGGSGLLAGISGVGSPNTQAGDIKINATGAVNLYGSTINIESSQGLVELPTSIIDPASLIANSCIAPRREGQGSFIITGTGGLPTLPDDPVSSAFETYTVPLRMGREGEMGKFNPKSRHEAQVGKPAIASGPLIQNPKFPRSYPMVEATGIYHLASGQQFLGRCP